MNIGSPRIEVPLSSSLYSNFIILTIIYKTTQIVLMIIIDLMKSYQIRTNTLRTIIKFHLLNIPTKITILSKVIIQIPLINLHPIKPIYLHPTNTQIILITIKASS